jgi:hypothetical protein
VPGDTGEYIRGTLVRPPPLKVKEVWVEDQRYIVCRNEDQAQKGRQDREAIAAARKDALQAGDKSLVGKLSPVPANDGGALHHRPGRTQGEECYDSKWLLTTNTELAAGDVALKYKQL